MSSGRSTRRSRVLVVEHESDARGAILTALEKRFTALDIGMASDGVAAWEVLRSGDTDLALWDMAAPGLGGGELVRRLASDSPSPRRPYLILLCDGASGGEISGVMERGADDCILKPLQHEELVVRVGAGLRRVEQARDLRERAVQLERLYERQCEFLSWVSHEIRTPLSAILSSANILLRYGQERPESVERFARLIHQEGQRLTRLINNFLDLAKIEAGQVEWNLSPVPPADLVAHVRESFAALAGERSVHLAATLPDQAASIWTDRDKLTQVLLNLVSNAIKHSPEGGTVALRCLLPASGGTRIEVEDQGPGIPPGDEERVFERFQQLGGGDERTGTGLGLAISRQIVEHLGGKVWAESARDVGALFVVDLPGKEAEAGDGPV